ncbi:MAG: hypothetical protein ACLQBX_02655 [Candidatus Limnocylindrales bacterium]
MTPQTMPALGASHRLRTASSGVVATFVLLAVLACGGSTAGATGNAASAAPAAVTAAATPVVAGGTLLAVRGTGNKTSSSFQASGASVNVNWTYNCASASVAPGASAGSGTFSLNFYGTEGSPALSDQLVSEFGATDSGTTNEPLNGAKGPFHFEVDSDCTWSVTVLGAP